MIFDRNENRPVAVLLGAGSMGTAILRWVAAGKKLLLGDISEANLKRTADELKYSGYDVETFVVDACDKASVEAFAAKAASLGDVMTFIDTAGASPSQASPEKSSPLIWWAPPSRWTHSARSWRAAARGWWSPA